MTDEGAVEAGTRAGGTAVGESPDLRTSGPHLTAALLCERVLVEKDDTVSVIRVVDRLIYTMNTPLNTSLLPPLPPIATFTFTAFIALKPGTRLGQMTVRIDQISPSRQRSPGTLFEFVLGTDGMNLISEIELTTAEPGDHWFEVLLDGRAITRIPLEIVLRPSADSGEAAP